MSDLVKQASVDEFSLSPTADGTASLQVVLKIAEVCNIACTYCYFFFSGDQTFKQHPPIIGANVLDDFLDFIRKTGESCSARRISVILHGGEPLLVPHNIIEHVIAGLEILRDRGSIDAFEINMQTNGLLLNDKNVDFVIRNHINLGVSIDGLKEDHDVHRIDHMKRGTYDRAVAGYHRARLACLSERRGAPGLLSVIQPDRDGMAIFQNFVQELKCYSMDFLLPDMFNDDPAIDEDYVQGIADFMIGVFRGWTKLDNKNIKVRFIDEILYALLADEGAAGYLQSQIDYFRIVTVSSDGTIAPDDTIKTIAPRFQNLGNVTDYQDIEGVYQNDVFSELNSIALNPAQKCRSCDFLGICGGGKPVNRFSQAREFDNPSVFCEALISIRVEIISWLIECGTPMEDIERRMQIARDSVKELNQSEGFDVNSKIFA